MIGNIFNSFPIKNIGFEKIISLSGSDKSLIQRKLAPRRNSDRYKT